MARRAPLLRARLTSTAILIKPYFLIFLFLAMSAQLEPAARFSLYEAAEKVSAAAELWAYLQAAYFPYDTGAEAGGRGQALAGERCRRNNERMARWTAGERNFFGRGRPLLNRRDAGALRGAKRDVLEALAKLVSPELAMGSASTEDRVRIFLQSQTSQLEGALLASSLQTLVAGSGAGTAQVELDERVREVSACVLVRLAPLIAIEKTAHSLKNVSVGPNLILARRPGWGTRVLGSPARGQRVSGRVSRKVWTPGRGRFAPALDGCAIIRGPNAERGDRMVQRLKKKRGGTGNGFGGGGAGSRLQGHGRRSAPPV